MQRIIRSRTLVPGPPGEGMDPGQVAEIEDFKDRGESQVFDVRKYAGSDNLAVNARSAILATYAAIEAAGGGTMIFGSGTDYHIDTECRINATVPLVIDLNNQRITTNPAISWIISGEVISSGLALDASVSRGDITLTLDDAADVEPGDILFLSEPVVMESGWNTQRLATFLVRSISGDTVTLTSRSRMPFSTSATIAHYRPPARLVVRNGILHFGSGTIQDEGGSRQLRLRGLRAPRVESVTFSSDQAWKSGGPGGTGLTIERCVDTLITSPHAEAIGYGMIVSESLNTSVANMTAERVRHPVAPAGWADGVYVNGLTTNRTWQSTDSHPAFDVHYTNVYAAHDQSFPNLRCVNGSIRNARIVTEADDNTDGPYFHSLVLTDPTWYDDATITLENFELVAPNATNRRTMRANYGHFVGKNIVAPMLNKTRVPSFENTLKSITLENCRNPDGTPWDRKAFRVNARVHENPNLPATLDSGVYHINPMASAIDSVGGVLKCYGRIFEDVTTDPVSVTITIHDNVFPDVTLSYPTRILGILTLRATVTHSNSGGFDILTKVYHFRHQVASTSTVAFPTTAAYEDSATGQSNESLTLAISNPTQEGVTQLGNQYPDSTVSIDVDITSGRTSPRYGLTYELTLIRA